MSSETSFIWLSRSLVRDSGSIGGEYARPASFDKLNSNDFQVKSVRIYSRLSLKPMVTGHRGNQISCRGREMFVGSNLVIQWVPGSGKVVRGDTKISPSVLQRGVSRYISQNGLIILLCLITYRSHFFLQK